MSETRRRNGGDRQQIAYVTVHDGAETRLLVAAAGEALRDVLLRNDLSPHSRLTRRANCGGRGLCATCGVRLLDEQAPEHWHDDLAARFGYPRLSCQLTVTDDIEIRLDREKVVWGRREPSS
ncbi:2Fe-2S iron-sulfur cluster-binding protein [Haloarchaeobius amylolyticus]|uniref:2Fe-2S iron-sulfur cluster-binding protein n=1 Tax=Haloarchaeobius amylolyticus TaxID=1198296 RepID=UPI003F63FD2B